MTYLASDNAARVATRGRALIKATAQDQGGAARRASPDAFDSSGGPFRRRDVVSHGARHLFSARSFRFSCGNKQRAVFEVVLRGTAGSTRDQAACAMLRFITPADGSCSDLDGAEHVARCGRHAHFEAVRFRDADDTLRANTFGASRTRS